MSLDRVGCRSLLRHLPAHSRLGRERRAAQEHGRGEPARPIEQQADGDGHRRSVAGRAGRIGIDRDRGAADRRVGQVSADGRGHLAGGRAIEDRHASAFARGVSEDLLVSFRQGRMNC